jgi:hypothetical protein
VTIFRFIHDILFYSHNAVHQDLSVGYCITATDLSVASVYAAELDADSLSFDTALYNSGTSSLLGVVDMGSTLSVADSVFLNSLLSVGGNAIFDSAVHMLGALSVNGQVTLGGATFVHDKLDVVGASRCKCNGLLCTLFLRILRRRVQGARECTLALMYHNGMQSERRRSYWRLGSYQAP